jgi:Malectin domain
VLPAGNIFLVLGQPNPYTDTNGNVWQPEVGDDGCHPYDNGGAWPNTPDITLYKIACFSSNDIRFDITVPNGNYQITGKFAETEAVSAGFRLMDLEAQGQTVYHNVDVVAAAGGVNKPVDFNVPAKVTDGTLSFVVRHVAGDFALISALKIVPLSLTGGGTPGPVAPPTGIQIIIK